jgi:hypothetical protein
MMEETVTLIYCLCDEFLSAYGYADDPQAEVPTAEILTIPLVAATFFGGNHERGRVYLKAHRIFSRVPSKSRLSRRLHAVPEEVWRALFSVLSECFKAANETGEYIVDSFPVPVCDNIRIRRCKLYPLTPQDPFRGKVASKRRYFYGLRVHLLVTATGEPVEFCLAPGSESDLLPFREFSLDLPEGSVIYADKLYNDYHYEDLLREIGIEFQPLRKKNSKRKREGWEEYLCQHARKQVETTISGITGLFPKSIHAVTPRGFELKVFCFVLAFAFQSLSCQSA